VAGGSSIARPHVIFFWGEEAVPFGLGLTEVELR
jgi:hypothetical protein